MVRILIVDDDTAVRTAMRVVLEREGYQVSAAASGREGLAAVEANRFDVVICDIFMPGMDGIETINAFHKVDPNLPVIAMSGFMFRDGQHPAPDYLSLSTKLGAACSLRKPFRPHELISTVQRCVAGSPRTSGIGATG
jgi:CheY-like chemotaxis protein